VTESFSQPRSLAGRGFSLYSCRVPSGATSFDQTDNLILIEEHHARV
jgi:hypothetical protein